MKINKKKYNQNPLLCDEVSVVEPTPQSVVEPEPDPVKEEPIEISEDKVMGTKFTMSIQTIVALVGIISAGVGGYYMLLQEIELAKQLPEPVSVENIFNDEYPSKPGGHNHLVLLNNTKHKSVDYKKIWMMYLILLMNMKKKLKS